MPPVVYWNSKLTNVGLLSYKVFDNYNRPVSRNSLSNLLNSNIFSNKTLQAYVQLYYEASSIDEKERINIDACDLLHTDDYQIYLQKTRQVRNLNAAQSRKVRSMCNKLVYYSSTREFTSKKSGTYKMKVAFLTLTAPDTATPKQILEAFSGFTDYLQRTANCHYVWKKELGETNKKLHFHVLINNFIPYYIVSWKWKRLLIAQGVTWPLNEKGKDTTSHTRIELPRSRKLVAHYIGKYLSKAFDLPGSYGYISGHSSILKKLEEYTYIEGDLPNNELQSLNKSFKVISSDYFSLVCCDLLKIKEMCPGIFALFESQYLLFNSLLTLPQKFHYT